MNSGGFDTNGVQYGNASQMWSVEATTERERDMWYEKGIDYWKQIDASVDGVLGGFGHISKNDLQFSRKFLDQILGKYIENAKARGVPLIVSDCGAGVGRITKGLLSDIFDEVDLIEPVEHFVEKAKEDLRDTKAKINFITKSLQEVDVCYNRYDVVWIQWCIGHLTDDDAVTFLKKCGSSLKPSGFIVVKENNARRGFVLDKEDSSITRSDAYLVQLFKQADLKIVNSQVEDDLPAGLFIVRAYALRPKTILNS